MTLLFIKLTKVKYRQLLRDRSKLFDLITPSVSSKLCMIALITLGLLTQDLRHPKLKLYH